MNKLIIVFALVIGLEYTLAEECPNGGKLYKNKCYVYHSDDATWDNAAESCKRATTDLVSNIEDKSENDFITSISDKKTIWTALSKNGHPSKFLWPDGSEATYINWAENEPNNAHNNEYCVEIMAFQHWNNPPGSWNDNSCTAKHPYVCTYDPALVTKCPNGGKSYKNKCYVFHAEEKRWDQANEICTNSGNNLVSNIADKAENDFIASIAERKIVWTSLNKIGHPSKFLWPDGSEPTYINWAVNEPNNAHSNEYCVELMSDEVSNNHPGLWNDNTCTTRRPFVCTYNLGNAPSKTGGTNTDTSYITTEIIYL